LNFEFESPQAAQQNCTKVKLWRGSSADEQVAEKAETGDRDGRDRGEKDFKASEDGENIALQLCVLAEINEMKVGTPGIRHRPSTPRYKTSKDLVRGILNEKLKEDEPVDECSRTLRPAAAVQRCG
jgi:hypothetical protein